MATFQNIYYKRTAATAKACYMCFRPTTTVLATLNTTDFLYTCDGHLADRGFATLLEEPAPHDGGGGGVGGGGGGAGEQRKVSEEEIQRAKEEWEERQRRKKEKEKEKEGDKDKKDKDKDKDKDGDKATSSQTKTAIPPPAPIPVPGAVHATAKPSHQRYTLHRDVWAMRLAEHKKRRQATVVKEVAPRLPVTPRGGV